MQLDLKTPDSDALAAALRTFDLDAVVVEIDAALAALKAKGHPASCSCKLCFAARRIKSVLNRLAQLEQGSNGGPPAGE